MEKSELNIIFELTLQGLWKWVIQLKTKWSQSYMTNRNSVLPTECVCVQRQLLPDRWCDCSDASIILVKQGELQEDLC